MGIKEALLEERKRIKAKFDGLQEKLVGLVKEKEKDTVPPYVDIDHDKIWFEDNYKKPLEDGERKARKIKEERLKR